MQRIRLIGASRRQKRNLKRQVNIEGSSKLSLIKFLRRIISRKQNTISKPQISLRKTFPILARVRSFIPCINVFSLLLQSLAISQGIKSVPLHLCIISAKRTKLTFPKRSEE